MNRNEGNELYLKAQKLALRDYREKMLAGNRRFCLCWTISCKMSLWKIKFPSARWISR